MNININIQTFYTEDGTLLRGILSKGKEENETVVVHINGRGSGQFNNMTTRMRNFYIQNNIDFFSYDQRFWQYGEKVFKTEKDVGKYSVEDAQKDLKGALKFVKELGYQNIILEGHSLGTEIATKYLNNNFDDKISRLILMSPSDHIEAMKNLPKTYKEITMKELTEAYDKALENVRQNKPDEIVLDKGMLGVYSAKQFLECNSKNGGFNQFSYEDNNTFPNITVPVTIILGSKDPLLSNISKAEQYFNHAFSNGKTFVFDTSHTLEGNDVLEVLQDTLPQKKGTLLLQKKGTINKIIVLLSVLFFLGIFVWIFNH